MKTLTAAAFALGLSVSLSHAAFFADTETFEAFTANALLSGGTRGTWTTVNTVVTNAGAYAGSQAAFLAELASATNTVCETGPSKAWTDFQAIPVPGIVPSVIPTNSASALFLFNPDGILQAWDGITEAWVICTNDVWGFSLPAYTNGYVRVSVYQNFSNKTYAIMLNGRVVVQDLGFPKSDIGDYTRFVMENAGNSAYLDNLLIRVQVPSDLTASSNHVAQADAQELDENGYVARTLHVEPSNTEPVPYFASLQAALDAYRAGDVISVAAGTYAENITISNAVTFAQSVIIDGTLDITTSGSLTALSSLTVSNAITLAANSSLSVSGSLQADSTLSAGSGATITADDTLTAAGTISLDGSTLTSGGAFDAQAITLANGSILTANGTLTAAGAVAVNTGSSLVLNADGNSAASLSAAGGTIVIGAAHDLTISGIVALSVDGGSTGTVSLASGSTLTIDDEEAHSMAAGTMIVATNGTFRDGALDVTGTFTIHGANYVAALGGTVIGQPLSFEDDFDRYGVGTLVSGMKVFGWDAPAGTPMVTNTLAQSGSNAVDLPDGSSVLLAIDDANKAPRNVVWTDYYTLPVFGVGPGDSPDTTGKSFLAYVNTNGNLVVYDGAGSGGWEECNTNQAGEAVDGLFAADAFTRMTIYQNFDTRKYVVFVDSTQLVATGTFPDSAAPPATYNSLLVDNTGGGSNAGSVSRLDTVLVTASLPPGLTGDHDGDGMADGDEIHFYGDLDSFSGSQGSVFRFQ